VELRLPPDHKIMSSNPTFGVFEWSTNRTIIMIKCCAFSSLG